MLLSSTVTVFEDFGFLPRFRFTMVGGGLGWALGGMIILLMSTSDEILVVLMLSSSVSLPVESSLPLSQSESELAAAKLMIAVVLAALAVLAFFLSGRGIDNDSEIRRRRPVRCQLDLKISLSH